MRVRSEPKDRAAFLIEYKEIARRIECQTGWQSYPNRKRGFGSIRAELINRASGVGHAHKKIVCRIKCQSRSSFNAVGKRCLTSIRSQLQDGVIGCGEKQIAQVVECQISSSRATGHQHRSGATGYQDDRNSHCSLSLCSTSFSDIRCVLTIFQLPASSNLIVKRKSTLNPSDISPGSSRFAMIFCRLA